MATNPMQRRTRNAFLVGTLMGLAIAVVVGFVFVTQINELKKEVSAFKALQRNFVVLTADVDSGGEITPELCQMQVVQTKMNIENNFDPSSAIDENGNLKKFFAKVDLKAGTIITEDMLYEEGKETVADTRVQEINTLVLPTQLLAGDYVDIRLRFPSGENYIVIAKKRVLQANADTIWVELSEAETLILDNAIVESYIVEGSKLYATTYSEAGMQKPATPTYSVSKKVLGLINADPNITEEARNEIWLRYNAEQRDGSISNALDKFVDSADSSISSGTDDEISRLKESREEYLTMLDGGY